MTKNLSTRLKLFVRSIVSRTFIVHMTKNLSTRLKPCTCNKISQGKGSYDKESLYEIKTLLNYSYGRKKQYGSYDKESLYEIKTVDLLRKKHGSLDGSYDKESLYEIKTTMKRNSQQ